MFCATGLVFRPDSFSCFRSRSRFPRYRGRRVLFSSFALPDSFLAVPQPLGLVFMFCAPRLVFGGIMGVGTRFPVLRTRTPFRRYRGCQVPFSSFERPDSFSAYPRATGSVFIFCATGLGFGGTEGVESRLHVLRSRTHFLRYEGRQVPFSCFTIPDSFSTETRVPGPVFLFCAPVVVSHGTEGVRSRFQVLYSRTHFWRYRGFHDLRVRTHFLRYRGRRLPFHVLCTQTRFRRYRGRRLPFSCFARPDSCSSLPRALSPVFMFCTIRLIFGYIEGVGSRFYVLCSQTRFRWYQGLWVPFSCFARPDSF
jgi:hypothetical protein